MFVASINRKLIFLTKSLPHTSFMARIGSQISFWDECCNPQILRSLVSVDNMKRQLVKLVNKIGHQLSSCRHRPYFQDRSTEVRKFMDSFTIQPPCNGG